MLHKDYSYTTISEFRWALREIELKLAEIHEELANIDEEQGKPIDMTTWYQLDAQGHKLLVDLDEYRKAYAEIYTAYKAHL